MTSLLAVEGAGIGGVAQGAVAAPAAPVAAPARIASNQSFDTALAAMRPAEAPSLGMEFEAATLSSFLAHLLPSDDAQIWGGSAGAMWRGIYAERLAADVAAAGGIGLAAVIDRMVGAEERA